MAKAVPIPPGVLDAVDRILADGRPTARAAPRFDALVHALIRERRLQSELTASSPDHRRADEPSPGGRTR